MNVSAIGETVQRHATGPGPDRRRPAAMDKSRERADIELVRPLKERIGP